MQKVDSLITEELYAIVPTKVYVEEEFSLRLLASNQPNNDLLVRLFDYNKKDLIVDTIEQYFKELYGYDLRLIEYAMQMTYPNNKKKQQIINQVLIFVHFKGFYATIGDDKKPFDDTINIDFGNIGTFKYIENEIVTFKINQNTSTMTNMYAPDSNFEQFEEVARITEEPCNKWIVYELLYRLNVQRDKHIPILQREIQKFRNRIANYSRQSYKDFALDFNTIHCSYEQRLYCFTKLDQEYKKLCGIGKYDQQWWKL